MLHATPLCMGIAHDGESRTSHGNVFWPFDGYNNTLVRYDFEKPHGPKSLDHDLANVRRYDEVQLKRVPNVPSHIVVDSATRAVYIADTGNNRIIVLNADSGRFSHSLQVFTRLPHTRPGRQKKPASSIACLDVLNLERS